MKRTMVILAAFLGPVLAIAAGPASRDHAASAPMPVADPNYIPKAGDRAVLYSVSSERIPLKLWCTTTSQQWREFIKNLFADPAKAGAKGRDAEALVYLDSRTEVEVVGCESIKVEGGDDGPPLTCTCCTIRVLSGPYRGKTLFTPDFQITRLVESRAVPPDSRETAIAPRDVAPATAPRPPVVPETATPSPGPPVAPEATAPSLKPPVVTEAASSQLAAVVTEAASSRPPAVPEATAPSLKPPVVPAAPPPRAPAVAVTEASVPFVVERGTPPASPAPTPAPSASALAPKPTLRSRPSRPQTPVAASPPAPVETAAPRNMDEVAPAAARPSPAERTDVAPRTIVNRGVSPAPPRRAVPAPAVVVGSGPSEASSSTSGGRVVVPADPTRLATLPVDRRPRLEQASPGGPGATDRGAPARLPAASSVHSGAGLYATARELDEDHKSLEALVQYRAFIKAYPDSPEARLASGRIAALTTILEIEAQESRARLLFLRAVDFEVSGKTGPALAHFRQIIKVYPRTPAARAAAVRVRVLEDAGPSGGQ